MAGMFSLLNNNLRPESGQNFPNNCSRDDGNGGRSTPRARTPVMNRRDFPRMGTAELHPMLRRSICSLIVAAVVIVTGIIFILVDLLALNYQTSVRGIVILTIGFVQVTVGVVWYRRSQLKLKHYKERVEQARQKKLKAKLSTHNQGAEMDLMFFAPSKHTAKWPTRKTCNGDNCKESLTSPNGNHIIFPVTQNHARNPIHSPPRPLSSQHIFQNEINGNKTNSDTFKTFQKEESPPIRISKSGAHVQVPFVEQCTSCAFLNNSKDDFSENSFIIPLTTS